MLSNIQFGLAKIIRSSGQALDVIGRKFELNPYIESLQVSSKVVKFGKSVPKIDNIFVAQSASVIGKVEIQTKSSVWYGAVIRADLNVVTIGQGTTVGDRCMIHCDDKSPTVIGNGVVIGSGSILHGCKVEDSSLIGEGAQILDGAIIGKSSIILPGSLVPMGKIVPAGQVWAGVPAKYTRNVTDAETESIVALALENSKLAEQHALESAKSWQVIEDEEYDYEQSAGRSEHYYRRLNAKELSKKLGEIENHQIPGRILDSGISSRTHPESRPKD